MDLGKRVLILFSLAALLPCSAMTVSQARTAAEVHENDCSPPKESASFASTQRQVFVWFVAEKIHSGDRIQVRWTDPAGNIANTADYGELAASASVCLANQLPVAGFGPASAPGLWTVDVSLNGAVVASKRFRITADASLGVQQVTSVTWPGGQIAESDFTVHGSGFRPGSLVHVAEYTRSSGWRYLASLQPKSVTASEIVAHYSGLPAAEYLVIVQDPDGKMSRPAPFVIATSGGYHLPIGGGQPWVLTQGPHGAFSHWGNSLQAYDIAPRSARCVTAMRAGIVHTFDRGMSQDHHHRTFGNYITIDHGDGEYSHYAHLATGTFVVHDGQRVEQGQALATVGNSGYTLGDGGGYHVHVHVTRAFAISAQSIPFEMDDLPGGSRGGSQRTIVSAHTGPLCDCSRAQPGGDSTPGAALAVAAVRSVQKRPPQFTSAVTVEQWWNNVISVPHKAKALEVDLAWHDAGANLDLHLISPTGKHYAWYADTTGYSGHETNPQHFRLPAPEPGVWRVSVQGVKGTAAPIDFDLITTGLKLN